MAPQIWEGTRRGAGWHGNPEGGRSGLGSCPVPQGSLGSEGGKPGPAARPLPAQSQWLSLVSSTNLPVLLSFCPSCPSLLFLSSPQPVQVLSFFFSFCPCPCPCPVRLSVCLSLSQETVKVHVIGKGRGQGCTRIRGKAMGRAQARQR